MRRFLRAALALGFIACAPLAVLAQHYPSKPIRLIVPYAAGGGTDTVVRVLGPGRAPRVLGHQFPGSAATKGGYLT